MKKTLVLAIAVVLIALSILVLVAGYYSALANQQAPSKPIPSQSNFYLGDSRIFIISANASYGNYPFPTVTDDPDESPIAEKGEPCVIINVTLRNDYSYQNPAPAPLNGSGKVYLALTANLFSNETKISSKDITNAFPLDSVFVNRAFTELNYGETTEVTDYIATSSHNVTSFQLVPYYVGEYPPP